VIDAITPPGMQLFFLNRGARGDEFFSRPVKQDKRIL
jgi:hypothetical protein